MDNGGDGRDMTNQIIKKIVMNRKEQIGERVRDGNYSKFKLIDNKESLNIKKMGNSPVKEQPYHSIVHDDSIIQLRS